MTYYNYRQMDFNFDKVVTLMGSHDHVSLSGCVTLAAWHVIGRLTCLADSLAGRHGRQYFSTKPSLCAVPKRYWREHCREACQETQTSIWLASHLERLTPDLEEHEFESPVRKELGALTKSEKILGGQVSPQYTYFVAKHVFEDH
jgi:hypothetical protein